jgi:hypothetical protein
MRVWPPTRIREFYAGVFDCEFAGFDGARDQVFDQTFKLGPRDFDRHVLRP